MLDFEALAGHVLRWDVLGLEGPTSEEKARQAYRQAAKRVHPDAGGSHEAWVKLDKAWSDICQFMSWPR